jgi:hypothetical protein
MSSVEEYFIWTEAFNCVEILEPFLESFRTHHAHPIHVFTSPEEKALVPKIDGVRVLTPSDNWLTCILFCSSKRIAKGYTKGHLGTARLWSNIFRTRKEKILIHIDADTIFVGECIQPIIEEIKQGTDICGTRRPYFYRSYRKKGRDGKLLDKHPDLVNTDLLGIRNLSLPRRFSPLFTRNIRGKRPLRYPVVDFFDPITLSIAYGGGRLRYLDSPLQGSRGVNQLDSPIFMNRISFAAVGSGLNFFKNPKIVTSSGYRDFALSSFSLYSKYILDCDVGIPTLGDAELIQKISKLDKETWTLRNV